MAPDPEERTRSHSPDEPFRLKNAVVATLVNAHAHADGASIPLHEAIRFDPPDELIAEERDRFQDAVDNYLDLMEERQGELDVRRSRDILERPTKTGRWALTGRPDLVLRRPDGSCEVRRVLMRRGDTNAKPLDERSVAPGLALLLGEASLRIVDLYLVHPARYEELVITEREFTTFARDVNRAVHKALDDPDPAARPGWYCGECESLPGCPGVPQVRPSDLSAGRSGV